MKRYRLISKTRFYAFIFGVLTFTLITTMIFNIQDVQGESLDKYDIIIVNSGDTIWDIASEYNNNKYDDLREYVYQIKKANNILGDSIKPDQKLRIPKTL